MAKSYSFRNLTNITRRIKAGRCEYAFIEMMACPSGCLNGGGQLKPPEGSDARSLLKNIELVLRAQRGEEVKDFSLSRMEKVLKVLVGMINEHPSVLYTKFQEAAKPEPSAHRLDW